MELHDAIIVGAGPAGLTAATYLGRFRRRCAVLEDGHSRARWIPRSHNIPGFSAGIGGKQFLETLKDQALRYGARMQRTHVSSLSVNDGVFSVGNDQETLYSRYVLLATGVSDHLPAIEGAAEAIARGLLRVCPICDAYEAIDSRIAVIGDGPVGEREANFLRHYSSDVTLLQLGTAPLAQPANSYDAGGFERISIQLSQLRLQENEVSLRSAKGERRFDVVYLALGCSPRHHLARALGARCDSQGSLRVDAHQKTSVPGLYAAGDLVRGLNQVVVAAAESAIAATAIHNELRGA